MFLGQLPGLLLSLHLLFRFPGDDIPIVRGSALAALEGKNDPIGKCVTLMLPLPPLNPRNNPVHQACHSLFAAGKNSCQEAFLSLKL